MLILLLIIPLIGSLLLLPITDSKETKSQMRSIALATSLLNLFISLIMWIQFDSSILEYQFVTNISQELGFNSLNLNVGLDSVSIYFVLLTTFITPVCILSNWDDINMKFKYYSSWTKCSCFWTGWLTRV